MKNNTKLSRTERLEIKILFDREYSLRDIAKALKRSPNTISYEVKTNSVHGVYDPLKADRKAKTRMRNAKFQWKKIDHDPDLETYIVEKLKLGWNPDEISGRMKEDNEPFFASKTAIYEWLYTARGQRYCTYLYSKRYGRKRRKKKTKKEMISDRISIENRPKGAKNRSRYGHFEGDTVVSGRGGAGGMSVLIDRKSRFLAVRKIASMSSKENLRKIRDMKESLGMKSVTFDNGIENREHTEIGVPTFFCDPYSSWQKGGVENVNKMLRRYFPKRTDFRDVSQREIDRVVDLINKKPRKILGYRSAYEVALEHGVLLRES